MSENIANIKTNIKRKKGTVEFLKLLNLEVDNVPKRPIRENYKSDTDYRKAVEQYQEKIFKHKKAQKIQEKFTAFGQAGLVTAGQTDDPLLETDSYRTLDLKAEYQEKYTRYIEAKYNWNDIILPSLKDELLNSLQEINILKGNNIKKSMTHIVQSLPKYIKKEGRRVSLDDVKKIQQVQSFITEAKKLSTDQTQDLLESIILNKVLNFYIRIKSTYTTNVSKPAEEFFKLAREINDRSLTTKFNLELLKQTEGVNNNIENIESAVDAIANIQEGHIKKETPVLTKLLQTVTAPWVTDSNYYFNEHPDNFSSVIVDALSSNSINGYQGLRKYSLYSADTMYTQLKVSCHKKPDEKYGYNAWVQINEGPYNPKYCDIDDRGRKHLQETNKKSKAHKEGLAECSYGLTGDSYLKTALPEGRIRVWKLGRFGKGGDSLEWFSPFIQINPGPDIEFLSRLVNRLSLQTFRPSLLLREDKPKDRRIVKAGYLKPHTYFFYS